VSKSKFPEICGLWIVVVASVVGAVKPSSLSAAAKSMVREVAGGDAAAYAVNDPSDD
jgi:hypothetical protein